MVITSVPPARTAYAVLLSNGPASRQSVNSTRKLHQIYLRGTPGTLRAFCKCRWHNRKTKEYASEA